MKLSEAIDELIVLHLQGEPGNSNWISIEEGRQQRLHYHERLDQLRNEIDSVAQPTHKEQPND